MKNTDTLDSIKIRTLSSSVSVTKGAAGCVGDRGGPPVRR